MKKEFNIGDVFYRKKDDKKLKITVIGIFYEGLNGHWKWKDEDIMMNDLEKQIQLAEEPLYNFSTFTNYILDYNGFIKEIEEDQKLLHEYRKYIFE